MVVRNLLISEVTVCRSFEAGLCEVGKLPKLPTDPRGVAGETSPLQPGESAENIGCWISVELRNPTGALGGLAATTIYVLSVDAFLAGIIGGAILGLILASVHDLYLKSRSLRTRGIVFGLILWLVLNATSFGVGVRPPKRHPVGGNRTGGISSLRNPTGSILQDSDENMSQWEES